MVLNHGVRSEYLGPTEFSQAHYTLSTLKKTPQLAANTEKTGANQDIIIGQIQLTGHNEQSKENVLIVQNQLQTVKCQIQGCYIYLSA